jgi:hypothetical protein
MTKEHAEIIAAKRIADLKKMISNAGGSDDVISGQFEKNLRIIMECLLPNGIDIIPTLFWRMKSESLAN